MPMSKNKEDVIHTQIHGNRHVNLRFEIKVMKYGTIGLNMMHSHAKYGMSIPKIWPRHKFMVKKTHF